MSATLNSTSTPGVTWKKVILWLQFWNKKHTLVHSVLFYVGYLLCLGEVSKSTVIAGGSLSKYSARVVIRGEMEY